MIIGENEITKLRTDLGEKLGQKIIVKGSLGRNKPFEKEATIKNTYADHFNIKYDNEVGNSSYKYVDILTKTIEVDVFDGEQYSPLAMPVEQKNKII